MKFTVYAKLMAIIGGVLFFSSHLAVANSSAQISEPSTSIENISLYFLFASLTLLLLTVLRLLQYRRQIEKKASELVTINKQMQLEIDESIWSKIGGRPKGV